MSYLNDLSGKLFDQMNSGWLGGKIEGLTGRDYQKHLINTSLAGATPLGPAAGYGMDFQQAQQEGKSGWGRVGGNAEKSAAILATIFGGEALAGGGGDAAGAGADSAVPVQEAGFSAGSTPSGAGWTPGTGGGTFGQGTGSGLAGNNYAQLLSKGLNGYSQGSSQGKTQVANQSLSPEMSIDNFAQQPASPPSGAYSPLSASTSNPYAPPSAPAGMAYNDPNNPSMVTNSMNPYALNVQSQLPLLNGLYNMGQSYGR